MNSSTITAVDWARAIHEEWRRPVRLFRAPGRVNLIGEHTDYNDGFVLPAAIRFSTFVTAAGRADRLITIRSEHYPDAREFDLDALPGTAENLWSDYAAGVILSLVKAGVQLSGADLLIRGEVPIG
jgi:galactokinase